MSSFAVEIKNLQKTYGKHQVLQGVSLQVPQGALYGLLGPNGAGKTTLLRCLLGLTAAGSGECLIDGQDTRYPQTRQRAGGMVDAPAFYPHLTARENVLIVAKLRGIPLSRATTGLEIVGLTGAMNRPAHTYSLGMKQRLGIALALVGEPPVLILDEPQNGLDPQGMRDMRTLLEELQRLGHTLLVSSHLLGEMEQLVDHLGIMAAGKLVYQGSMEAFRQGAQTRLELVTAQPEQAIQALKRSDLACHQEDACVYLPAGTHQPAVARCLLNAGVDWASLTVRGTSIEEQYFQLTSGKNLQGAA